MSESEISFSKFSGLVLRHNIDLVKREVVISGHITWKTLSRLDKQLKLLEIQDGDINIVVNTPGGDIEAALGIIDRITISPCNVRTIGTGIVMSAGIPILASGKYREATKHTRFMHHGASMGVPYSRLSNLENEVKYTKELSGTLDKFLAAKTKKPYSFWASTGKHIDHYFNSEDAKEFGLIDEILG